jgi:hypothetical protein
VRPHHRFGTFNLVRPDDFGPLPLNDLEELRFRTTAPRVHPDAHPVPVKRPRRFVRGEEEVVLVADIDEAEASLVDLKPPFPDLPAAAPQLGLCPLSCFL